MLSEIVFRKYIYRRKNVLSFVCMDTEYFRPRNTVEWKLEATYPFKRMQQISTSVETSLYRTSALSKQLQCKLFGPLIYVFGRQETAKYRSVPSDTRLKSCSSNWRSKILAHMHFSCFRTANNLQLSSRRKMSSATQKEPFRKFIDNMGTPYRTVHTNVQKKTSVTIRND